MAISSFKASSSKRLSPSGIDESLRSEALFLCVLPFKQSNALFVCLYSVFYFVRDRFSFNICSSTCVRFSVAFHRFRRCLSS